jgi:hypothetical protein
VVEPSAALVAGLADLTAALDDPDVDIAQSIERLAVTVLSAVPSYLGLSLVMDAHGQRIVVAAMDQPTTDDDIATSLRLPLATATSTGDITLVLYAGVPGAFVDLAADMDWLIGDDGAEAVLDADLSAPAESISGLAELSVVNQAIGVLIAGGYTLEQASEILDVLAADGAGDRHTAAARLLTELDEERGRR